MHHANRSIVLLAVLGACLSACGSSTTPKIPASESVQAVAGSSVGRIVVSAIGAQRIGLQTAPVLRTPIAPKSVPRSGGPTVVIPYSAVVYDPDGSTYSFVQEAPLTYAEVPVAVDHISGSSAYLTRGPPAGAKVVSVGAEELFGVQTGVLAQT